MGLIFLTGLPGSGKTTVGAIVARELQYRFVDLDDRIRKRAGKSIPQIFSEDGESMFRELESKILADLCTMPKAVVALGAGALEREENFTRVMAKGILVYLRVNLRFIVERNRDANWRPLLSGATTDEELLRKLVELRRRRRYRYLAAPIIVDEFQRQTPVEMAEKVLRALRLHAAV